MEFAHAGLLQFQHVYKRLPVFVLFQFFEQRLLRLGHRTSDAMAFAFEFTDVDAGAGRFRLGHDARYFVNISLPARVMRRK